MKCELHHFKLKENINRYRFGANLSMGFGGIFSRRLRDEKEREMTGKSRAFFPSSWRVGEEFHGEGKLLDRSCHREYNPLPQVWEGSMPEEGSHSSKADGLYGTGGMTAGSLPRVN